MVPGVSGRLISLEILAGALTATREADFASSWRDEHRHLGPASGLLAMVEQGLHPLVETLGLTPHAALDCTKQRAALSLDGAGGPIIAVVTYWGESLDRHFTDAMAIAAKRSASFAFLFNGTHLRLLQTRRFHSRRFVDIDLDLAADHPGTAAALHLLFGAGAFDTSPNRIEALIAASDAQGVLVSRSLKDGVLEASGHLLNALIAHSRQSSVGSAFDQALTIVYRLLFLFFAEARMLVPLWHPIYRESYSLEALRREVLTRPAVGLWETIRAISRLAHAGCRAGDLRVTPFNGRLFSPSRVPLIERRDLDEEAARSALVVLSTRRAPDGDSRVPLVYQDLGVEQLGAVYETLLDYQPQIETPSRGTSRRRRITARLERGASVRKASGTYYTPRGITDYLVRQALDPLVANRSAAEVLALRVLDPSMGSGAFLVSACRFLAVAYEEALLREGGCLASDIGTHERARFRRLVAERCLFGVDLNPMAVQLARLSLWLATLSADRPLSFLDHHLQSGDSLSGTWLWCLRRAPREGRRIVDERPLFAASGVEAAIHAALPVRFSLEQAPNDTPSDVRAKERALARLSDPGGRLARWKQVANLWCARWFSSAPPPPSAFADMCDAIVHGKGTLPTATAARILQASDEAAARHRLFHWELEFPEVFFAETGTRRDNPGFDAVIGNPPWEMVRADADAAGNQERRAVVRFSRDSGVYEAQSDGHANCYQLFVERALALTRRGGSIALVLPGGFASDHGSARLRRHLFERSAIESITGFDNRRGIFPIHRGVKFLLLSTRAGTTTTTFRCRFGETDVAALDQPDAESQRPSLFVSRNLLRTLSGDDMTIPDVRSSRDLAIAERAAALFAPLRSSSWAAEFGRELNASDDRQHFHDGSGGCPVIGGRQIEPFRVHPEDAPHRILTRDAARLLGDRYLRPRLAYRDVASPTNRLTLIAAVLPAGIVSTHTLFCLKSPLPRAAHDFLCGLFNSYVMNFLVRQRVSAHVTTTIVEHLPVPGFDQAVRWFDEVASAARRLSSCQDSGALAHLNGIVARLYSLDTNDFRHVLESFPLVPASERQSALSAFEALR